MEAWKLFPKLKRSLLDLFHSPHSEVTNTSEVKLLSRVRPTLCDPMDCSLPGSSAHGVPPGKNTGKGCHFLLQGIFPTQGSSLGLPHCRPTLYHLSRLGNPKATHKTLLFSQWLLLLKQ